MRRLRSTQPDICRRDSLPGPAARRGSLLIEMVVCTIILSTVAAILAPALHGVKRQRISTKFESMALIEMSNIAERLRVRGEGQQAVPELSQWFANRYSSATLDVQMLPIGPDDVLQAVRITIARTEFNGEVEVKRSLVTWIPREAAE